MLVEGEATLGPPSYNFGNLSGPAYVGGVGDVAGYSDRHYSGDKVASAPFEAGDSCRARFRTTGRYLIVDDNEQCGGNRVSFTGIYVKTPR